jgi:hypothetical protein
MQKLRELINLAAQGDFNAVMSYQTPVKHRNRRLELHREQLGFCAYCFNRMAKALGKDNTVTADHIIPRAHGGSDERDNLAGACVTCNQKKADSPLVIFLLNAQRSKHNLPVYKVRPTAPVAPKREWFIDPEPIFSKQLEHFDYV